MATLRIIIILVLSFTATVSGHNITDILMHFPAYSEFNKYLTQTKLNDDINSRQPVTILVFNNSLVKEFLSDQPLSIVKFALSIHVLLDYFDKRKILAIGGGSTTTTSLFQTTGKAVGDNGRVNITDLVGNKVGFGSADKGSRLDALYERSVKQIPYNISIMEISSPIIAPGILKLSPASDVNFTSLLEEAGCKTFAKMISNTGVLEIFQTVEPRGLTVFAPTDAAFKAPGLPDFDELSNSEVDSLLLYHAITGYAPKVSLMTEKNPIRTLASNDITDFYLTVRSKGDSVTLDSGMDVSRVESTVLDSVPISIFKIDHVLFPPGFYTKSPSPATVPVPEAAPPSPSTPGSAHTPIASSPAPVATTSPILSPPAPPTSSPASSPAPAENPTADTGNINSSCGIKAPVIFLALLTISVWGMISIVG